MRTKRRAAWLRRCVRAAVVVALVAGVPACFHVHHHGRPPKHHKSKHGHHGEHHEKRHEALGVKLIFDSATGVYVVVGYPDHYHDGHYFYRHVGGEWWMSTHLRDSWVTVPLKRIPRGLRHASKKPHHGHGPPAKHAH